MFNRFFLMSSTSRKRVVLISVLFFLVVITTVVLIIFCYEKKKNNEYLAFIPNKNYSSKSYLDIIIEERSLENKYGNNLKIYHSADNNCKYMVSLSYTKTSKEDIPSDYTPCIYCLPTSESIDDSYVRLRKLMLFNESSTSTSTEVIEEIEKCFDAIPDNYKDTASIKEEFIYIKSQIDVLQNFSTANYANHETALTLLYQDSYYTKWDLKKFVNSSAFENKNILTSALLTEWKDSEGNYLKFAEKENNDAWLYTNLPNKKDFSKDYNYFIEGNLIGYYVQDDYSTKFNAFRIESISYDTIRVFCFKNDTYYILNNTTDTFR